MGHNSHIIAEISMSPMDKGVKLGPYVARALDIIDTSGIDYELHSMGTILEGSWSDVMEVIAECHKALEEDCARITTSIKLDYNAGHQDQMAGKVQSVEQELGRTLQTGRSR